MQVVLQVELGRLVHQVFLELLVIQVDAAARVLLDRLDRLVIRVLQDSKVALVFLVPLGQLVDQVQLASLDHRALQVDIAHFNAV